MSDTSKFPFDSILLDGGASATAVADPPRPSFSRSVPDVSATGLLPPTRKPVAVTVPELPPAIPPAADPVIPNPMASTPPPKAGSVRGLVWDLVRPTRTKWAILAGGLSLVAGAYGLNLVTPPSPPPPSKRELIEVAQLTGPMPQVMDERQRPPSIGEERVAAAPVPVKEQAPVPLPAPLPEPIKNERIVRAQAEEPVPAVVPIPVTPAPAGPLPVPVAVETVTPVSLPPVVTDKPDMPKPLPAPVPPVKAEPVKPEPATPLPAPVFVEKQDPPIKPVEKLETPVKPVEKFEIVPVPSEKKVEPLPLPTPVNDPKPVPEPGVKISPVNDQKPVTTLPPVGGLVNDPKTEKPVEAAPLPVKPSPVDPKPVDAVPVPKPITLDLKPVDVVPVAEKTPDPIPNPVFKEAPAPAVTKESPPAPVGAPPPKKGFEVDVVKVRATDTYTSISEAFYQSRKYASALRAFNGDADIGRLQEVEVPPLFELQKFTGTPSREPEPVGGRGVIPTRATMPAEPPVRGPVIDPTGDAGESVDWGPVGKKRPVVKYEKFTTPKEGMTARDVARAVYADENEWARLIGPRGAKLRADDRLPRGTELTVPREELPWK